MAIGMKNLIISSEIKEKLALKHNLSSEDVEQCFKNRTHSYLRDTRLEHLTEPITEWFISENDSGKLIKIVCIFNNGQIFLKSAFPPNEKEISIYNSISIPC
jgi:hypothetical protein